MTREVLKSGTTSFCPTVITAGFEQIRDAMKAIRIACRLEAGGDGVFIIFFDNTVSGSGRKLGI